LGDRLKSFYYPFIITKRENDATGEGERESHRWHKLRVWKSGTRKDAEGEELMKTEKDIRN